MFRARWTLWIALACLPTAAAAQSVAPLRLGVALGTSFNDVEFGPLGAHAAVSLTSQPLGSRWGLRVEALFDGRNRILHHNLGQDPARYSTTSLAFLISPTYRLWGTRRGLYAIAGLGVYHEWAEEQRLQRVDVRRWSSSELGVNAGLGLDFQLFNRDAFVEMRLHSAAFDGRVPLSLGIKF